MELKDTGPPWWQGDGGRGGLTHSPSNGSWHCSVFFFFHFFNELQKICIFTWNPIDSNLKAIKHWVRQMLRGWEQYLSHVSRSQLHTCFYTKRKAHGCRWGCPGRETGSWHAPDTSVFRSDLMLFPVGADLDSQLSNSGPAFKHWCVAHQSSLMSGESKSSALLLNSHPQAAANGFSSTFPDFAKLSSFTSQPSWVPWGYLCRGQVASELLSTLGHNFN